MTGQGNTELEPDLVRISLLRSLSCQVCYYLNVSWNCFYSGKCFRGHKQDVTLKSVWDLCYSLLAQSSASNFFAMEVFRKSWWAPVSTISCVCWSFRKEIWQWNCIHTRCSALGWLSKIINYKKSREDIVMVFFSCYSLMCMDAISTAIATIAVQTLWNSHPLYFLGKEKYIND